MKEYTVTVEEQIVEKRTLKVHAPSAQLAAKEAYNAVMNDPNDLVSEKINVEERSFFAKSSEGAVEVFNDCDFEDDE